MTDSMDPVFANGLRELLIRHVDAAPRRRRLAGWRWGIGAAIAVGLLGGGTALAAQLAVLPGADAHSELAAPVSVTRTGTATIELGPRPKGATEVSLSFDPLGVGTYELGRGGAAVTVPAPAPAASGVSDWTIAHPVDDPTTAYLQPSQLDPGGRSFTITTSDPSLRWVATLTWVSARTTEWGVNAAGQSYGVQNDSGSPDLIAVVATNGKDGYAYSKDLDGADGTTAMKSFRTPQDALDWQKEHGGTDTYIPVYESDGKTKIGVFKVGP